MHGMIQVPRKLFSWGSVAAFSAVFFVTLTSILWAENAALYAGILFSNSLPAVEKVNFFFGVYTSLATNFSALGATLLLLLVMLFSLYSVLFVLYIRRSRVVKPATSAVGFFGFFAGLFGVGCAACGAVLFSGLLGLFGGAALLAALPLQGVEFGIIGVVILGAGCWWLVNKLTDPLVCPIE